MAQTRRAKRANRIKTFVLKPLMTDKEIEAKEGTYFDGICTTSGANNLGYRLATSHGKGYQIINEDADVYGLVDGQKQLLAKFRKNVFPKPVTELGWNSFYRAAAASRSRGAAAGPIQAKSKYWKTRKLVETNGWWAKYRSGGKTSKMRVNNPVFSSVVGYFEATPFMKLPCRLTTYTQNFFKDYKQGLPFIEAIDKEFKHLVPQAHKKQYQRIHGTPTYQIEDTAFSSVTINRNFRTALHKDAGDFKDGYGNLTVLERGKYHGGETLFPQFGVGFNLRTGDFIAMDVHQWHCNTALYETQEDKAFNKTLDPIKYYKTKTGTHGSDHPFTRISFVCYVREDLKGCDSAKTKAYYKRIGFDEKSKE